MKLLLACVAVLLLSGSAATEEQRLPTLGEFCSQSPGSCERMAQAAYADVCRLTVYVCDVPAPRLVLLPLVDGLNGVYLTGMSVVFVNSELPADWLAYSTIAHEMTHYLQEVYAPGLPRCDREGEAFAVKNMILRERDRRDWQWHDWREDYGC